MAANSDSRFCLRIKNFKQVASSQNISYQTLKEQVIKELKSDAFLKMVFSDADVQTHKRSITSYFTKSNTNATQQKQHQELIKEIQDDEIVLSECLTLDQCESVLVHLKQNDKFKKLSIESGLAAGAVPANPYNGEPTSPFDGTNAKTNLGPQRRIAVRLKDGAAGEGYTKEDEILVKADALKTSLKMWIQEDARKALNNPLDKSTQWRRTMYPDPSNFFERIQNVHLIPVLIAAFIAIVFLLTLFA